MTLLVLACCASLSPSQRTESFALGIYWSFGSCIRSGGGEDGDGPIDYGDNAGCTVTKMEQHGNCSVCLCTISQ